MRIITNIFLVVFLCLNCLTVNVSAENELSTNSDGQSIVNDADVPEASPSFDSTTIVSSSTEEKNDNSEINDKQEDITKYSLTVEYYFDGEYTTTLELARYKPGEYGLIASTTDGYVTKEVDGETKYYFIDSIRINSEPVAENKIEISEDDDGNQEYLYLMGAEDTTIDISFSSKSTAESTEHTSQEVVYQNNDGDIILTLDDSYEVSTISYIVFRSDRDDCNRYYLYWCQNFYKENNTITIPYEEEIKNSNLKGGLNYFVSVHYDGDIQKNIGGKFYIGKGSDRKDVPLYNAIQEENGDILVTFNETEFSEKVTEIRLQNSKTQISQQFTKEDFNISDDKKSITIPYDSVKKSQLTIDEYYVFIVCDTMFSDSPEYFEFDSEIKMNITMGISLPLLPEYSIYQEDNGDIVIYSDNETLIGLIGGINCRDVNGNISEIFFESHLKREGNKITVPFKYIFCSSLLSNNNYSFEIMLYKDDVFKYDFNDVTCDVLINKGTIKEFLTVNQDQNGDIVFRLNDNQVYNSLLEVPLESIRLDSAYSSIYRVEIDKQYFQITENSITIPYDVVESPNLIEGLTYSANFNGFHSFIPLDFVINTGSKKKYPSDYSVSQNENGDIVFSFEDSEFPSNVTQIYFYGYQHDRYSDFNSDRLTNEGSTITIPYSMVQKSQLVEGDYYVDIYYDTDQYFDTIPRKRITITSGTKLPSLPDFSIYQEDDGDIVIESENIDLIKSINYLGYDVGSYGYGFNSSHFVLEDNRAIIPYKYVAISNLTSGNTFTFRIQLKSDDVFLYENNDLKKDVLINKGSIRQYLSSRQDADGNIIIEMSDNEIYESFENLSLESIYLGGSDENNGRYYSHSFYNISNLTSGNTITIPYSQIEYSNLKQGLEYSIELNNDGAYCYLPVSLLLNKGSVKKDAPDYSVSQKDNGDIVFSFGNADFPSNITQIYFYEYRHDWHDYFGSDRLTYVGSTITIPYSIIEKSRLVEGEYQIDIYHDSKLYFNNIPSKRITITSGTKLPSLPDFSIYQEDNGDIVISSENSDLIKSINYLNYYVGSYGYSLNSSNFILEDNRAIVPYKYVVMSNLTSGNIFSFSIQLKSDDVFLYEDNYLKKDILISKGSIAQYLSSRQDEDGNIIIEMSDNEIYESFEDLSLESVSLSSSDENNGRYYSQEFYNISNLISGNTITIPYSQIEYSNLKQGLEYSIKLNDDSAYCYLPARLLLNKGSVKKDAPDYSVSQNNNGDIVLSFDNADFPSNIKQIRFEGYSAGKDAYFSSEKFNCEGNIVTIPYSIIEKSQLVEGEYYVRLGYNSEEYFTNIPSKRITITSGTKLPSLPDFSIYQEDDGDIVIESENSDLIKAIDRLNYSVGSYGYSFNSSNFIFEDNRAIIPYKYVVMSNLTSGNTFDFEIELMSDDVFLYEDNYLKKDILISKGSIAQYLSSRQDADGNIIIEISDNEIYESFENISLESIYLGASDENNGRYYSQSFYNISNLISGNTITIPYSQIEYSNLKQGLEYLISISNDNGSISLPARIILNKGSVKKDAPDYSVSQNDNGDVVLSFDNADFVQSITSVSFQGYWFDAYVTFNSDKLVRENKTITIPYSIIEKSQLVKGEYWVHIYHDSKLYFDNIPSKRIIITSGTKLPSLPDFSIYQEDDGDIVIESESEELVANIGEISYYSLSNQRAGRYYFYDKDIIKESKKVVIPYTSVMLSKLEADGNYSFTIDLKSDDVFLYNYESRTRNLLIKKGSLLDEIEIVQQENGNIEFTLNNILEATNVFGLINTIEFENNSKRVYRGLYLNKEDLIIADNKITIPYNEIEYSNLEGNLEYTVYLNSCQLSDEILIIKGSKKKEAVIESVVQKDNGDIVITSPDADIIRKTSQVSFSNSQTHKNVTFYSDTFSRNLENNTISISYETVKKSQLIEGEYKFDFWFDDRYTDYYFDYASCSVSIKKGTTLPNLPDFEIYQKDDGDIVLYSDSKELIKEIEYIAYSPISNQRAGGPALFMESFIVEDNTITIPYSNVIFSYFESDKMHSFNIDLKSDDKFLYDYEEATREVFISKGSIRQYLSSKQGENGNIIIEINDNEICESFKDLSLESIYFDGYDEVNDRNYQQNFYNIINLTSGNTITIPYSQIEYSNLKQGLEYLVSISNDNGSISLPARIILNKGSVKKDAPDYTVNQNDNGDIVFSFGNADFPSNINQIRFAGYSAGKDAYFSSEKFICEGNIITIPYSIIEKSQLVEGEYLVDIYYDSKLYFDDIPNKRITITSGTKLPSLPDFNIYQEDDGDIVLYSDSCELIKLINYIGYYSLNSQRAGAPAFFEESFVVDENTITIPYRVVKYSYIEDNALHEFNISLKDNDVFLVNGNDTREAFIKYGSLIKDALYLDVNSDISGVLSVQFDNNDILIKLSVGEYELNYLPLNSCEKEIRVNKDSLIFDYSNHRVYIVSGIEHEGYIHLNIMYGDEIIATTVTQVNSEPVMNYEKAMENVDTEKLLSFANSYYESLYPDINILIGGIGIYADVVHENEADDFFKLYGLSNNNSLVIDISLLPNSISYNTSSNVEIVKIPYDYPGEYIEVEFSVSSEQMSKLGINKDNYSQNTIAVLREHNGKVDLLDAAFEPVEVGDVIISYKVTFKTDKMSLFAISNSKSIVKLPSGGIDDGDSSIAVPGDLNADGEINGVDRILLRNYLTNKITEDKIDIIAADVNCDNAVNALDRVYLRNLVTGKIKK